MGSFIKEKRLFSKKRKYNWNVGDNFSCLKRSEIALQNFAAKLYIKNSELFRHVKLFG